MVLDVAKLEKELLEAQVALFTAAMLTKCDETSDYLLEVLDGERNHDWHDIGAKRRAEREELYDARPIEVVEEG